MFLTKMDDLLPVTNIRHSSSDLLQSHIPDVKIVHNPSERLIVALELQLLTE